MSQLLTSAGALVEKIRINVISREIRDGRPVWIKRRRPLARPVLIGSNLFFRMAGARVRAVENPAQWQEWEIGCFEGLHGADGLRAVPVGTDGVAADEVPGINLTVPLDNGTLTARMAAAAGRELRRAHAWTCEAFDGPWSHGDAHLGNFVYEPEADRARIIDFEMRHRSTLPSKERHADDVLVFLQDLIGRMPSEGWRECAQAFLEAYGRPDIFERVHAGLRTPGPGLSWLWWMVRASFPPRERLRRRLEETRAMLTMSGETAAAA